MRLDFLKRHIREMQPGGISPHHWTFRWIEVAPTLAPAVAPAPGSLQGEAPAGVWLSAISEGQQIHRFIAITSDGHHQAFTYDGRDSPWFEKFIGGIQFHLSLETLRQDLDRRMAATNFAAIRGGGKLSKLGQAAALLASAITVDPAKPDAYVELATLSLLMAQRSARLSSEETVNAVSRQQASAAVKFVRDVAPEDPRIPRLEQMLSSTLHF